MKNKEYRCIYYTVIIKNEDALYKLRHVLSLNLYSGLTIMNGNGKGDLSTTYSSTSYGRITGIYSENEDKLQTIP